MSQLESTDSRAQALIKFAEQTYDIVHNCPEMLPVRNELEAHIRALPTLKSSQATRTFDGLGTKLWNASVRLVSDEASSEAVRIGTLVRVFALLLLDHAHHGSLQHSKDRDQRIRIIKIGIRATRLCLSKNELDLALITLERCSQYIPENTAAPLIQIINADEGIPAGNELILNNLTCEYHLLRLSHASKSARPDLAEYFYSKIDLSRCSPDLRVKAADLFLEIAKCLSQPDKRKDAVGWLERGLNELTLHDAESLSQEAIEMLLTIGARLVEELTVLNTSASRCRALEVVDRLEGIHSVGKRVALLIARFRLLVTEHRVDVDNVTEVLLRIVKLLVLTEDNFKMIMQIIHKAFKVTALSSLVALAALIESRMLPELQACQGKDTKVRVWLEKSSVTYTLFATNHATNSGNDTIPELLDLCDKIMASSGTAFSAQATHAAQTLVWKASKNSDLATSYRWCQLLRHEVFDNAGHLNKARIGRKIMRNALEEENHPLAREAFFQMPPVAQNEPLTRFLCFKLAMKMKDEELAMDSLSVIMKNSAKDPTYLYACVLEAQASDMRHMTVVCLQAMLDQQPAGIDLPSLLRCIARLMSTELHTGKSEQLSETDLAAALGVFETAAKFIGDLRKSSHWRTEVQWWSKNTYNLAIRLCGSLPPEMLLRLLDVCVTFLESYPEDACLMQQDGVRRRRLLCDFLATTALIIMGRLPTQKDNNYVFRCYLHAQQRIQTFQSLYDRLRDGSSDDVSMKNRVFAMLKFDLECILKLKQWDRLSTALKTCLDIPGIRRWDTLADILIIMHRELDHATQDTHVEMMTQLLQRMINDTWKKEKEMTKVARWLRFTITMCLEHTQDDFSLKLLQQAAAMAENGHKRKQELYPEAELQWLSATSFNHAIDLLSEGREEFLAWMDGALALARWSSDSGGLHAILTQKKEVAVKRERTERE